VTEASVRTTERLQVVDRRRRPRTVGTASPASAVSPTSTAVLTDIGPTPSTNWIREYRRLAFTSDVVVVLLANMLGLWLRYGIFRSPVEFAAETRLGYRLAAFFIAGAWLLATTTSGCYDARFLGTGSEEFKRIVNASIRIAAVIGLVCYLSKTDLSRGYVATTLLLGVLGLLISRYVLRKYVHRLRRKGRWSHRVLAVGARGAVAELIAQTRAEPYAGFTVVGACLSRQEPGLKFGDTTVPVLGSLDSVDDAVRLCEADAVAVTRAPEIGSEWLTRLAWRLEGSGVALAVAPALTNVAGPRIAIRPVAGLPLLHVEEPELSGRARLLKTVFERAFATLALVLLAPVLLVIAAVIRIDSRGPILFRQERVGLDGKPFRLFKFRSMVSDAEIVTMRVAHLNDADETGFLFKIRQDPRVTRAGRWLRRYSLDELPQLINVLRGDMALVGPRPPLPEEVERYGPDLRRRLIVKPGITGLWQVSGRSDLSWDDTVRLDLYYVENWSLALDCQILWKTMFAVVLGRGAY
jgi:exopolysaccharide biosynthesis polyprenyl glycosylphosphotransferase